LKTDIDVTPPGPFRPGDLIEAIAVFNGDVSLISQISINFVLQGEGDASYPYGTLFSLHGNLSEKPKAIALSGTLPRVKPGTYKLRDGSMTFDGTEIPVSIETRSEIVVSAYDTPEAPSLIDIDFQSRP
jgi:hypothetical protein